MLSLLQNELTRLIDITGQVMDYENMLRDTYKSTHVEEFSLKELYTDLIDSYEPQLTESCQKIIQKYHRSTHIRMDRNMCIQIFHNIISNFIKYAGTRSILTIDYLVTDREYIISFSDTVHGIPDEELEYVKEKFYRVDKWRNQEDKSMGIGLSIVERIAHLHRGSLTVEKNHPQGVKFIVKIGR